MSELVVLDDFSINLKDIQTNLQRIVGQIFRLLPTREEKEDWIKPLDTLIIELMGLAYFFPDQTKLISLVCKLQGLKEGGEDIDFMLYRRTIFEACSLCDEVRENLMIEGNSNV